MSYYLAGDKCGYYRVPDPTGAGRILIGGGRPGCVMHGIPPLKRRRARRARRARRHR